MRELYEDIVNNVDASFCLELKYISIRLGEWLYGKRRADHVKILKHTYPSLTWANGFVEAYLESNIVVLHGNEGPHPWRYRYDENKDLILYKGVSCIWKPDIKYPGNWYEMLKIAVDNYNTEKFEKHFLEHSED